MVGARTLVDSKALSGAIASLTELWCSTLHRAGPDLGWYRLLRDTHTLGLVATANGLESATLLPQPLTDVQYNEIVSTLVRKVRTDGAWPFVSTLNDVGVTDSTSNVVLALALIPQEERTGPVQHVIDRAVSWLSGNHLEHGGWGIVPGATFRPYSTALALQALFRTGAGDSLASQLGRQALVHSQAADGSWTDASGQASLPATAQALIALSQQPQPSIGYHHLIARAATWILNQDWSPGDVPGEFEEIFVSVNGSRRKIDYSFSGRAEAVSALVVAGNLSRRTLIGIAEVLSDASAARWSAYAGGRCRDFPQSWMLYDVSMCVCRIRDLVMANYDEVWRGFGRIVIHPFGRGAASRRWHEWGPPMALAASVVATTLLIIWAALFNKGLENPAVSWIGGTLIVGIGINLVSSWLWDRRPHAQ